MKKIEKLSPSAINTWYTCPFQYYCHYIDRREQIKTPDTTSFGSAIHDIIDHYYDNVSIDTTVDELPNMIETAFTELANWATQKRKADTRRVQKSLLTFETKRIKNKIHPPSFREKFLTAKISDDLPYIYGKPDAYFEDTGLIVDWKTGKHAEITDSLRIQGGVYKLIMEANGFKPKKVLFYFLVANKRVPIPPISSSWIESKVEDMMNNINNNKFIKNKNPLCRKWCGYRLDCDLDNTCPWVID